MSSHDFTLPREIEGEADRHTCGDEGLLPKLGTQVKSIMKSKLWPCIGEIGMSSWRS